MVIISYGSTQEFFPESQSGTPLGEDFSRQPTARSDPCVAAAVRRPFGRWRRGFVLFGKAHGPYVAGQERRNCVHQEGRLRQSSGAIAR